jgi:hypothetical protein
MGTGRIIVGLAFVCVSNNQTTMAFFHAANWPINLYETGRFQAKDSSPLQLGARQALSLFAMMLKSPC